MIVIRFTDEVEWLEELAKGPPLDALVRVTRQFVSSSSFPQLRSVSVIGGFLNARNQLVELTRYVGQTMGTGGSEEQKADERACVVIERIERKCADLKIEVRAGTFQPGD